MKLAIILGAAMLAAAVQPGHAQDAAAGEKVFAQCRACHQVGETARNTVGPVLNGVIGQKAAMREGYSYSAAMKDSAVTWDEATLAAYLQNPRLKIPGTKMIYAGLKDEKRMADLIAYLKQFDAAGKKAD
ncbi:cytochrome C [Bosea sp. Root381]|uniref:c-type cytochrome n=1 Tax=Bosea sp. Root381 TaxID=1736524 RepID=UPI000701E519|nr:cytochrome c family protein [Bosea sp. Root381]KRE09683.1 cytochrome C [Bosea sp. Root381]